MQGNQSKGLFMWKGGDPSTRKLFRILGLSSLHVNSPLGNDKRRIFSLDLKHKKECLI